MGCPNPDASSKTFSFSIKNKQNLVDPKIKIYYIKGQLVKRLSIDKNAINKTKGELTSSVQWDLKDNYYNYIANGIYFYRLEYKKQNSSVKKMLILRW